MGAIETIFILLGVGVVLLAAELFLPAHGLVGVAGVIVILTAIAKTFAINQWAGIGLLLAAVIAMPFAWSAVMAIWPKTPIGRKMVLPPVVSIPDPPVFHLGQIGKALTELRPMGVCDFAGAKVEATCDVGMVEAGRTVTVTSISNRRPIVRAV